MLGGDDEGRYRDKDHAEGLERRRECVVVVPPAVEDVGRGQGEREAACEALEATHDSGVLLSIELFFGYELRRVEVNVCVAIALAV